jgi:D-alanyl-D-alanine carboxypeptidase (penicillin-binding protein 5/6)
VAGVVALCAAASPGVGSASATATPTPLPVPASTVDPELSVGGPQLASMGVVVDRPSSVPAPPELRDVSWLLADMDTGEVIAAKAAHARLRPASTLKILTALTLIPRLDAATPYRVAAEDVIADGTRVGLLPGRTYTGDQLFGALLMASGNDAAYALARHGGGMDATLTAMNEQASQLGAHDTVAKDPAGLDVAGQTSSAYDLALIARAAMRLPDFRRYVTQKQIAFPGGTVGGRRTSYAVSNHNRLLHNYPGTIGVKNGYTSLAKRTFVSAVSRGGRTYLLTEMYGLEQSWRPQAAMFDWAFRHGDAVGPVGSLVEPGTVTEPPAADPADGQAAPAPSAAAAPTEGSRLPGGRAGGDAADWAEEVGTIQPASSPAWVGGAGLAAAVVLIGLLGVGARRRRH